MDTINPQEKAKELFNKMLNHCWYNTFPIDRYGVSYTKTIYKKNEARQCALIAVDLILTDLVIPIGINSEAYKFYEQVKDELNKLHYNNYGIS